MTCGDCFGGWLIFAGVRQILPHARHRNSGCARFPLNIRVATPGNAPLRRTRNCSPPGFPVLPGFPSGNSSGIRQNGVVLAVVAEADSTEPMALRSARSSVRLRARKSPSRRIALWPLIDLPSPWFPGSGLFAVGCRSWLVWASAGGDLISDHEPIRFAVQIERVWLSFPASRQIGCGCRFERSGTEVSFVGRSQTSPEPTGGVCM